MFWPERLIRGVNYVHFRAKLGPFLSPYREEQCKLPQWIVMWYALMLELQVGLPERAGQTPALRCEPLIISQINFACVIMVYHHSLPWNGPA